MKKDIKYSKKELIQGVYNKDSRVIKSIIDECYPVIENFVLSNSGNKLDADDTFQESLIILYRKIREENFSLTCSIKTFLFSVARNKWLHELRRKSSQEDISAVSEMLIDLDDETLHLIEKNERLKLYRESFEELNEICKKVIRMFLMKVPLAEITAMMGFSSEQTARNKRYRCKVELIRIIQKSTKFKELGYGNIK